MAGLDPERRMTVQLELTTDPQNHDGSPGSNVTNRDTIGVMHMTDTLDAGGRERVAVNLANSLPRERYRTHLCTTRRDGPLAKLVGDDVGRLCLDRKRKIEFKAIRRLVKYVRENNVTVLHAHGTSLLYAYFASLFRPSIRIVWHDHFGTNERQERSVWLYRRLLKRVDAVLAVSNPLADWARNRLGFRDDRVWWLPNFASPSPEVTDTSLSLPGCDGNRIVQVANLRPVKDQRNLLQAMKQVVASHPQAHLLMVGAHSDADYTAKVKHDIDSLGLGQHVSLLGPRDDVPVILNECNIGVLSSTSEGLPVSLLEYGAAGLSIVATDVGQCRDVLDDGGAGTLVAPSQPAELASAIVHQLQHSDERQQLGDAIRQRVAKRYSSEAVIGQLTDIYQQII